MKRSEQTQTETMSDHEAAQRLGFPIRPLRAVMDREGLCMKLGNRRRLTMEQYEELKAVLTANPCPTLSTRAGPSKVSALTRARELANDAKQRQ